MYICKTLAWHRIGAPLLSILLFVTAAPLRAEILLRFDFENEAGDFENFPDHAAPHLAVGSWADLDGTLTSFAGNPGKAVAARSFDDGNTLLFTFELDPGFRLDLQGYSFDQRASSQGAAFWTLAVDATTVASGATSLEFSGMSGETLLADLNGAVTVAIMGTGGTGSSGTLRIDNFSLSGEITAVPLPSGLLLLSSTGLLFAAGMRRRT